ncbi:aldehyde dehydrogenase family protein [Pseudomonas putida]|uniref:aldehyde dehydrogenase family protein n=1 Tax=Pseudomonas putida TaxID=303 RepID=UPI0020A5B723|nr:aldehyde dehydrogenase family protein [Pseudomonas putida]
MTTHYIAGNWQAGQGDALQSLDRSARPWSGKAGCDACSGRSCGAGGAQCLSSLGANEPGGAHRRARRLRRPAQGQRRRTGPLHREETGKPCGVGHRSHQHGQQGSDLGAELPRAYRREERPLADATAVLRHKPHGVVAVFGPYNFPGHLPNGHIVPALLAGNCVVFSQRADPQGRRADGQVLDRRRVAERCAQPGAGRRETGVALAANPA